MVRNSLFTYCLVALFNAGYLLPFPKPAPPVGHQTGIWGLNYFFPFYPRLADSIRHSIGWLVGWLVGLSTIFEKISVSLILYSCNLVKCLWGA